jgi:hypothetical protein
MGARYLDFDVPGDIVSYQLERKFGTGPWVKNLSEGGVYLDHDLAESRNVDLGALEQATADAFAKQDGVAEVLCGEDIAKARHSATTLVDRRITASYFAGRSPDVIVIFQPFVVLKSPGGTTHGTPYSYDSQVPVVFYGFGVSPGSVSNAIAVTDLAPTLAGILHITAPSNSSGRPLALK